MSYEDFKNKAEETGYYVNEDKEFVEFLLENIQNNINRYGYGACPCRLASGKEEDDLDLICPCDYRDMDLNDYGACFCALYVTKDVLEGKIKLGSIPDRREKMRIKKEEETKGTAPTHKNQENQENPENQSEKSLCTLKYPVWRCKVCGYLCAREKPPATCPICKVDEKRFEKFL
ncbi:MAG: ferredoxin-thioredoxin reductase catalytic domain-containing protein [Methanobacteriaceae archaeon]